MTRIRGNRAAAKYLGIALSTISTLINDGNLKPVDTVQISDNVSQHIFDTDSLDAAKPYLRRKGRPKKPIVNS